MKEVVFNILIVVFLIFSSIGIWGVINPKSYNKNQKKKLSRKEILKIYSIVLAIVFIGIAITAPPTEKNNNEKNVEEQHATQEHRIRQAEEIIHEGIKPDPRYYWHEIIQVVDGDTVEARVDGKIEDIRIIGIDSPESTNKHECYGDESSDKAKEFLSGKWIQLEIDSTQNNRDKYNRLLRYVWFDGETDFGRRMIEEGYAKEYTYDIPYNKQSQYKETEESSKNNKNGLWSPETCDGKAHKPVEEIKTTTKPNSSISSSTSNSNGNSAPTISSSGGVVKKSSTGICHAPGTTYYNRTTNYTPYNSLDACLKSGGRLPKR